MCSRTHSWSVVETELKPGPCSSPLCGTVFRLVLQSTLFVHLHQRSLVSRRSRLVPSGDAHTLNTRPGARDWGSWRVLPVNFSITHFFPTWPKVLNTKGTQIKPRSQISALSPLRPFLEWQDSPSTTHSSLRWCWQALATQTGEGACGPAASPSPRSLWEIQSLRAHPRPAESEPAISAHLQETRVHMTIRVALASSVGPGMHASPIVPSSSGKGSSRGRGWGAAVRKALSALTTCCYFFLAWAASQGGKPRTCGLMTSGTEWQGSTRPDVKHRDRVASSCPADCTGLLGSILWAKEASETPLIACLQENVLWVSSNELQTISGTQPACRWGLPGL